MKKERYAVDRIVSGIAVLIPDNDGKPVELDAVVYSLSESDIVDITFDGEKIVSLVKLPDEREIRLARVRKKLEFLKNKNKK